MRILLQKSDQLSTSHVLVTRANKTLLKTIFTEFPFISLNNLKSLVYRKSILFHLKYQFRRPGRQHHSPPPNPTQPPATLLPSRQLKNSCQVITLNNTQFRKFGRKSIYLRAECNISRRGNQIFNGRPQLTVMHSKNQQFEEKIPTSRQ